MATLELLKKLISRPSITPDDAGCQAIIQERLEKCGFVAESLPHETISNLWIRHGTHPPLFVLAGHTDVVPTGPLDAWTSDPFIPTERHGKLYGRGAADMKSGLSAMVIAAENFVKKYPDHSGSIALLITSDEEGPAVHGTQKVVNMLTTRGEQIDYCIVGEASSDLVLGDKIRVGRRGSLHGTLTIHGRQGHIAYPQNVENPIHQIAPAIAELAATIWDQGNEDFPPTTFQISNIHAGTGATNVVPGRLELLFNFRFGTASTTESLQEKVTAILDNHSLNYDLALHCAARPFLTTRTGKLIPAAQNAIREITGTETILSTEGGTSDGRFIAPTGAEVIEIGPSNASAHQVDEHVALSDLDRLTTIYERVMEKLLLNHSLQN